MLPTAQGGPFMLGIDVLASRNYDLLRGKRVGLITNHTSITGRGVMTRVETGIIVQLADKIAFNDYHNICQAFAH